MLKRRLLAVLIALILALPAAPGIARAQDGGEEVRLTLDECLRTALENNLDLVSARKDPQLEEQNVELQRAALDPSVEASANYENTDSSQTIRGVDPVTELPVTEDGFDDQEVVTGSLAWTDPLAFGGVFGVKLNDYDNDQVSSGIGNTGYFEERIFTYSGNELTFSYDMPLLRGFGKEATTVDILLARSGLDISKENLRLAAMTTMKEVEDAYWDLLATREALDVAHESLTLAQDLYELNRKKVEVGTLAPIEVTQAEAGVASREEGVILAETSVENAEDNLCRLLGIPPEDPMWEQGIVPSDQPVFQEQTIDLPAALATAMERRPEMHNARQALEDSELSERVARSQARHGLDLSVKYIPSRADIGYSVFIPALAATVSDSTTDDSTTVWSVGLTYSYPLKNRAAKATYARARINLEKSGVAVQQAEQEIRVDVRTAARNVESGGKRVAAAKANTTLQRKTLEAEQRKFENGMSTSFEVLRIQTDLSEARQAEIQAILDYTKALADFERAKGTLLEARGLTLGS